MSLAALAGMIFTIASHARSPDSSTATGSAGRAVASRARSTAPREGVAGIVHADLWRLCVRHEALLLPTGSGRSGGTGLTRVSWRGPGLPGRPPRAPSRCRFVHVPVG